MALSTITVTVGQVWDDGKMLHVLGTLAWGASPLTYATGGNTLDLNDPLIKAQRTPQRVEIFSKAGAGFVYLYVPGTTNRNGKVMILTGAAAQSALTELSAGNVPAGVSGDTIGFEAMFLGQN